MSVVNKLKSATITGGKITALGGARVLATTMATTQVVTNPFRETRVSFARRYNDSLSKWERNLLYGVYDCEDCNEKCINTFPMKKGETRETSFSSSKIIAKQDTHCPKHFDAVKSYQKHKARSEKIRS